MRKYLLTLFCAIACAMMAQAQNYSVHTTTPSVKVVSGNTTTEAKKGMKLKGTDTLVIPEGGLVEIYNDFDKRVYKSLRPGRVSVTKLLIEARQVAADNSKNVSGRLNLGKNGSGGRQAYAEKGMVTRDICVADSTALACPAPCDSVGCPAACDSVGCPAACDSVPSTK